MSMFEEKHPGNCYKLNQYDGYENDSECAFSGFMPEGDLCAQSGGTAAGQRQQMQHDFRDAGAIMDCPVLVGPIQHKGRQVHADEVSIEKMNLQKMRQQNR